MTRTLAFLVLSFWSAHAFAGNRLTSLTLNKADRTATACATVEVFKNNERFSHPDFNYVIKIFGDNAIFDDYADDDVVCLKGSYVLDSRGIVAHLNINDVEVVTEADADSFVENLDEKDPLQKKVNTVDEGWATNITTGTTRLRAGLLKEAFDTKPGALKKLSEANFKDEYRFYEDEEVDTKLKTKAATFSAKDDVDVAVEALAEGNDYSPDNVDDRKALRKELKDLLKLLGKDDLLYTLVTSTKVKDENDDTMNVYSIMFVNKKTKKAFRIFVYQGTI